MLWMIKQLWVKEVEEWEEKCMSNTCSFWVPVVDNKCFDLYVAVGRDKTSCNLATTVVNCVN